MCNGWRDRVPKRLFCSGVDGNGRRVCIPRSLWHLRKLNLRWRRFISLRAAFPSATGTTTWAWRRVSVRDGSTWSSERLGWCWDIRSKRRMSLRSRVCWIMGMGDGWDQRVDANLDGVVLQNRCENGMIRGIRMTFWWMIREQEHRMIKWKGEWVLEDWREWVYPKQIPSKWIPSGNNWGISTSINSHVTTLNDHRFEAVVKELITISIVMLR